MAGRVEGFVKVLRFGKFYTNKELALFSGQGENVISFSNFRAGGIYTWKLDFIKMLPPHQL
jgi:hypothetical protein